MGILNLTPDSFSDAGLWQDRARALDHARQMIEDGADLIDLGAESTRPGASEVSPEEELRRLRPVLEALLQCGVPISVDTRKAEVMREVLAMGADLINDVSGFSDDRTIEAVGNSTAAVCVMHMQGSPGTMQQAPRYNDVIAEVGGFLAGRQVQLESAGIGPDRIVLDPGIGFGKTLEHNLLLLRHLESLRVGQGALMVGLSRKSMIQALTGQPVEGRLAGSLGGALAARRRGADLLRVHDVRATCDALRVYDAI
ncbi:MAG: dihydropteroate synthase [Burkholderiaceae bacterium]